MKFINADAAIELAETYRRLGIPRMYLCADDTLNNAIEYFRSKPDDFHVSNIPFVWIITLIQLCPPSTVK